MTAAIIRIVGLIGVIAVAITFFRTRRAQFPIAIRVFLWFMLWSVGTIGAVAALVPAWEIVIPFAAMMIPLFLMGAVVKYVGAHITLPNTRRMKAPAEAASQPPEADPQAGSIPDKHG